MFPPKDYLLDPVLSFSSALGVDEGALGAADGELGEAPAALLELDGLAGVAGLVEPDMLLEPLGLESFFDSCDEEDCDGVVDALLPALLRSQAASVSAPTLTAIRSLVMLRVIGVSLSGRRLRSKHRATGFSPMDQRVVRAKCRSGAPV